VSTLRDVADILAAANRRGLGVTFRSGGSSLSGQTLGEGLVVDVRTGFQRILSIGSDRVKVEPGVSISRVNGHLLKSGQKVGPDPASMIVSTIGGAVANNSSGMTCGVERNSYATILAATVVLADGFILDSSLPDAEQTLRQARPELVAGIIEIKDRLRANDASVSELRRQFSLKNTMGYNLQAFLDYDSPVEILVHLMVGSQGTLGFLGDVELETVPVLPHISTTLLVFETLEQASASIDHMTKFGATAIELLDSNSLGALHAEGLLAEILIPYVDEKSVVFLVDFEAQTQGVLATLSGTFAAEFSSQVLASNAQGDERAVLWKARKNVYAVVAKNRAPGTTALLEDVVVPTSKLVTLCVQIKTLCEDFGYHKPVFFGHVRDGNLHFMISDDFSTPAATAKLGDFTDEMANIVLALGGNLKAEHGAGRAMAPFVQRQFGETLFAVMREVKDLLDPRGILNPGVIFPVHDRSHLDHIKNVSKAHDIVDSCVECGFCETSCPSAGLTLTPRERIVALRERGGEVDSHSGKLTSQEAYEIDLTCAVDGMCAVNCPVGINTGSLVKDLRARSVTPSSEKVSLAAERNWRLVLKAGRVGLKIAGLVPRLSRIVTKGARFVLPRGSFPLYDSAVPGNGYSRSTLSNNGSDMVFLPSCMNSLFGDRELKDFLSIARDHGHSLEVPKGIESFCCGTPFSSKGFGEASKRRSDRNSDLFERHRGKTLIIDGSSCHQTLLAGSPRPTLELTQFIAENLADVPVQRKHDRIVLHPTCSGEKTGSNQAMRTLAERIATEVIVPVDWKCCGFAGDRGLLVPELTANATRIETEEMAGVSGVRVSNNQPCQIAMTQSSGVDYRSIVSAWLEAVR
jgi:D-lactate dehydrogenase